MHMILLRSVQTPSQTHAIEALSLESARELLLGHGFHRHGTIPDRWFKNHGGREWTADIMPLQPTWNIKTILSANT